jgi:hypothetical protein
MIKTMLLLLSALTLSAGTVVVRDSPVPTCLPCSSVITFVS